MVSPQRQLRLVDSQPLDRTKAEPTEAELVLAVRAGDRSAAKALYDRTWRLAYGLAYKLLGRDDPDLDDLVQESYVRVFSRLDRLEDPQAFVAWLRTIVVRLVQKRLAKRRRRRFLGHADAYEVDTERIASVSGPPEVAAQLRRVYSVLSSLPPAERTALVLRRVEGYTLPEIAEMMEVSESTAKRRLAAADKRLAVLR